MVYAGAMLGLVSLLVVRESSTVVPIAGFGARNPLGISTATGTKAGRTQVLGSVIVSVPFMGSIDPVAPAQPGSPTSTTAAFAGVAFANTATPATGTVLATDSVSVPLPFTAVLGMKLKFSADWSPVCRVLG